MAVSQGGYFTSKQAAAIGYTAPKRNYHVHVGNWVRERRGIFRLSTQPLPVRRDLILWWLWSRNRQDEPQGVYSHQTALSLLELTDVMPSRLHMTVPKTFRRSATIPKVIVIHMSDLPSSAVEHIDGVPVTKALRTLIDVAGSGELPLPDLQLAFAEAIRSGKITRAEIVAAKTDAAQRDALRLLQGRGKALMPGSRTYTSPRAFRQALEERLKTISRQEGTDFQRLCRQVPSTASWLDSSVNRPEIGFSKVGMQWSFAS